MSEVWKESATGNPLPEDQIERPTEVLGEQILGTIMEKGKEPPHVGTVYVYVCYTSTWLLLCKLFSTASDSRKISCTVASSAIDWQ